MLEQTQIQQIKLSEYQNNGISVRYYRDSIIENDNDIKAYQDLNYLELKVKEKLKELSNLKRESRIINKLKELKKVNLLDLKRELIRGC